MDLKWKLQRVLQILEESERVGALSDLERDIVLNDLREVYAELKFGITENEKQKTENEEPSEIAPTTPIAPIPPTEEVKSEPEVEPEPEPESKFKDEHEPEEETDDEPEVEVELIFDESDEQEEAESGERETENEEQSEIAPINPITPDTPIEEPTKESAEQEENLSTYNSPLSTPKRSPLLSLYEDAPTPVLGEQFHEKPSVADTIACPKGVAESAPVVSLHDAIGVADRFMLIRELFDGDATAYDSAIEALDGQVSFDDCVIFITEHYTWSPNSQATKLVMDLLQRKYNN